MPPHSTARTNTPRPPQHPHRILQALRALVFTSVTLAPLGCGSKSSPQPPPTPTPAADFTLTAAPATVALTAGAAPQQISVSANPVNNFATTVAVTLTGLPTGVTAAPATLTLTPGTPQTVTLTAASSAPLSSTTLTVSATSGTLTHTASVALTTAAAPPPPDFSLAATTPTLTLTAGSAPASTTLTLTGSNGFNGPATLTLSGLPAGVTASTLPLTLAPGTPQTLTLTAAPSAPLSSSTLTLTASSGTLTHTLTLVLNVSAAPQDFSLTLTPATLSLITGAAGQQITLSASPINGFNAPVALALSTLPAGVTATPSTLTLTPGTPASLTVAAAANATPGQSTLTVTASSGTLTHTATLALSTALPTGLDATTYHYDNARTGLNPNETILTPASVKSATFGKLRILPADGKVDAEPLYLSALTINGQTHNVLYVVTEHDSIYAYDADSGVQLWKVSALPPGEATSDDRNCGQIIPEIGITSTPVIDRRLGAHGTLFIVAMSKDSAGAYHQRLHALDLTTGAETTGSPTEVTGTYPGTGASSAGGHVPFIPGQYAERTGLLLMNGTVYLGWTSHCDIQPYTGWVMGYSESTLQQTQILNLTPNGSEGSIWMSGAGLAGDAAGNIYFLDANGTLDPSLTAAGFPINADYGNGILKLSTANNSLAVADYFEPYNSISESNADIDLGSGGALLLPDLTDASGSVRHLVVGAGKDSSIYVADRDNLGKYNPANNSHLYQEIPNALPSGAWSMPAWFNNTVFYGGVNDTLKAFAITSARLAATPSSRSTTAFSYPGATPGISASGNTNGIVWAVESGTSSPAVLHAYDATDLSHELYNSNQAPAARDAFGNGNKFITPLIINGKVFIGTPTGVATFGLLP